MLCTKRVVIESMGLDVTIKSAEPPEQATLQVRGSISGPANISCNHDHVDPAAVFTHHTWSRMHALSTIETAYRAVSVVM
jgi:hypothetical protein